MVYVQPPKKNAPLTMEYLYNLVAESANDETTGGTIRYGRRSSTNIGFRLSVMRIIKSGVIPSGAMLSPGWNIEYQRTPTSSPPLGVWTFFFELRPLPQSPIVALQYIKELMGLFVWDGNKYLLNKITSNKQLAQAIGIGSIFWSQIRALR
jgi:hypothetical protein